MPSFIIFLRVGILVLASSSEDDVEVLSSPGGASHVVCRTNNVFQVFASWAKDHDTVGTKYSDPEVTLGASIMLVTQREKLADGWKPTPPPCHQARRTEAFDLSEASCSRYCPTLGRNRRQIPSLPLNH